MTLGRVEEVLDEVAEDAERDYSPATLRYVLETLNEVRRKLGIDVLESD